MGGRGDGGREGDEDGGDEGLMGLMVLLEWKNCFKEALMGLE